MEVLDEPYFHRQVKITGNSANRRLPAAHSARFALLQSSKSRHPLLSAHILSTSSVAAVPRHLPLKGKAKIYPPLRCCRVLSLATRCFLHIFPPHPSRLCRATFPSRGRLKFTRPFCAVAEFKSRHSLLSAHILSTSSVAAMPRHLPLKGKAKIYPPVLRCCRVLSLATRCFLHISFPPHPSRLCRATFPSRGRLKFTRPCAGAEFKAPRLRRNPPKSPNTALPTWTVGICFANRPYLSTHTPICSNPRAIRRSRQIRPCRLGQSAFASHPRSRRSTKFLQFPMGCGMIERCEKRR